jgi:hypothetical protein
LFPPLPRALTADPWTPSLRRATPAVWRPTTAEKRDWRSRHTATDRRQIASRDVTTGSDRHIIWRPSRDRCQEPGKRKSAARTDPPTRLSPPVTPDPISLLSAARTDFSGEIIAAGNLRSQSSDRRSGFPEWSDRRRSPRTRSACLAPPARISPARLSPPVISGVSPPTDDPDFRSGVTAAGHPGPDQLA